MNIAMPDVPRLRTYRQEPASLDGAWDPGFWERIEPVKLAEVTSGQAPLQATRVRTAWNAHEWRILFQADDTKPWATLIQRDGPLWTEEVVEVFIDPVGDLESYFELEINPLGTVTDLVLRRTSNGWRKEFGWHAAGLASRARLTALGWEAELSIPFAAVALGSLEIGQCWRVNFLRIDRPLGAGTEADLSAWSATGGRNFHRAESFGVVEFCAEL